MARHISFSILYIIQGMIAKIRSAGFLRLYDISHITHRMYARGGGGGWSGAGLAVNPRAEHSDVPVHFVILRRLLAAHVEPPVARQVPLVEDGAVRTQEAILLVVVADPERLQRHTLVTISQTSSALPASCGQQGDENKECQEPRHYVVC